ncbi:hypothetical protein BDY24DRAFT_90729 [Mrakia frigida]|uniref:uncharacterized protein n=1 Tax=Mrakia frigida TaxID=29902 RepID=UPI003FCC1506
MSTRSLLPRSLPSLGSPSSSTSRGKLSSVTLSFPPAPPPSSFPPFFNRSQEQGLLINPSTGRPYCRLESRDELPRCFPPLPIPLPTPKPSSRSLSSSSISTQAHRPSSHPSPSYRPPWPSSLFPPTLLPSRSPLLARPFHCSPSNLATEAPPTPTPIVPIDLSVKEQDEFRFRKKQDSVGVHLIVDQVEKHNLSKEQEAILLRAIAGESFFFTGAAGSSMLSPVISEMRT